MGKGFWVEGLWHSGKSGYLGASIADDAFETGQSGVADEATRLAGALALVLDAPVGIVADAASLADDQISAGQGAIDAVQTFFDTEVG